MIPAFRKVKTDQRDVEQLQVNVGQQFAAMRDCPFLSGATISAALVSGDNVVNNPLGRTIQGYMVTDRDSDATVYRSASDLRTITLVASAPINISLWIF